MMIKKVMKVLATSALVVSSLPVFGSSAAETRDLVDDILDLLPKFERSLRNPNPNDFDTYLEVHGRLRDALDILRGNAPSTRPPERARVSYVCISRYGTGAAPFILLAKLDTGNVRIDRIAFGSEAACDTAIAGATNYFNRTQFCSSTYGTDAPPVSLFDISPTNVATDLLKFSSHDECREALAKPSLRREMLGFCHSRYATGAAPFVGSWLRANGTVETVTDSTYGSRQECERTL